MTNIATSPRADALDALEDLDPEALEHGIRCLLDTYQQTRSALIAWFLVHYAQTLCRHPDYEGSDEERCAWRRVSVRWRWLAQVPATGHRHTAEDLA